MKKTFAQLAAAALLVPAFVMSLSATASADEPDYPLTVCDYYDEDSENFMHRVVQTGDRTFKVTMADLYVVLKQGGTGTEGAGKYVPLPEDLRYFDNTVTVGPDVVVSNITLSQGVEFGPDPDNPFGMLWVDNSGFAINPGEEASLSGTVINWRRDQNGRIVGGEIVDPSFPPFVDIDEAAGVLEFEITVPDSVGGEVTLFSGATSGAPIRELNLVTNVWSLKDDESFAWSHPGCSVEMEALATDGGSDDGDDEDAADEGDDTDDEEVTDDGDDANEEDETEEVELTDGVLPNTGADVSDGFLGLGAITLMTGAALMVFARRRAVARQ